MLFEVGRGPAAELVQRQQRIGDRFGGHGEDAATDALRGVGLAHRIEFAGHLLRGELLGEGLDAGDLRLGIGLGGQRIEPQLAVDAQFDGQPLDAQRRGPRVGPTVGVEQVVVGLDRRVQVAVDAAHAALHEGRRQAGLQGGIRAALGDDALADVADRVDVEVGRRSDERVGPVAGGQCHLLAGREFQASVRAEVDHCIGPEGVTRPEVRGDVGVGRCGVGAVDDGEVVVARSGGQLR